MAGGLTHTIGGVDFLELNSGGSRCSLGCWQSLEIVDNKVFHPPGSDGNFLIRNGRTGGDIVALMRYIGLKATITAFFAADRATFSPKNSLTIVDSNGDTILRCRCLSFKVVGKMEPLGNNNKGKLDTIATFTTDA